MKSTLRTTDLVRKTDAFGWQMLELRWTMPGAAVSLAQQDAWSGGWST
jgi:hypothetical protein